MFYALGVFRYCCPDKDKDKDKKHQNETELKTQEKPKESAEQTCPYPDLPTLNPSLIREDGTYIA